MFVQLNKKSQIFNKKNNYIFHVNVFKEKNDGLILAEIELNSENSNHPKPKWLGEELTGQKNTTILNFRLNLL